MALHVGVEVLLTEEDLVAVESVADDRSLARVLLQVDLVLILAVKLSVAVLIAAEQFILRVPPRPLVIICHQGLLHNLSIWLVELSIFISGFC